MKARSDPHPNQVLATILRIYLAAWPSVSLAEGGTSDQGTEFNAAEPAQTNAQEDVRVIIVGVRPSLGTAQQIKRNKVEIVDSIVASDIDKLPDFSVTDALQRVTGVQIGRAIGDGTNVAIRGLTQMETTLNGREVFTAGTGRNLEFSDIPAEMVAGIDVYKTSSAEHIEGGVGGLVDLRTRRPFDFSGRQIAASVRGVHGDLVNRNKEQYSLLLSDRWRTNNLGQFGALLGLAYQERAYREDQKSSGSPVLRTVDGQSVPVANGTTETSSIGTRKRTGADMVLQWRPSAELDLYAEGHYAQLLTIQNSYQLGISTPTSAASSDTQGITWNNASAYTAGAARDTTDRTTQIAVGGTWTGRELTLKSDLSYTKSHNYLNYTAIVLRGTAASYTQDTSGAIPATHVGGTNLSSFPGGFTSVGIWYRTRPFDGDLKTARLDGEYQIAGDILDSLAAGLRYAKRHATDAPGLIGYDPSAPAVTNAAGVVSGNPNGDFFPGSTSVGNYIVGDPSNARDIGGLCRNMGIACSIPASNALGTWDIAEETQSGYVMAKIKTAELPLEGNGGVRLVRTREAVSGYRSDPGTGGVLPIDIASSYIDTLPSMNLRYALGNGLYLRGAASKTMTRPDFSQMSPSLTLNAVQYSGSAGNPALKPVRSNNVDLAIERYYGKTTSINLTVFAKKVDGFVTTQIAPETYDGVTYQVSRPQNANSADVKGLEFGYQQFYDFLPGWWRGLGLQANYTYVDSATLDPTLHQTVPLQNLSQHSLNLVGMYELGKLSARVAYNWRDKFLTSVAATGIGALPVYTKGYGWLDASVTYRLDDKTSVAIVGSNLLRTIRSSYYGTETHPDSRWINDRQLAITLTVHL